MPNLPDDFFSVPESWLIAIHIRGSVKYGSGSNTKTLMTNSTETLWRDGRRDYDPDCWFWANGVRPCVMLPGYGCNRKDRCVCTTEMCEALRRLRVMESEIAKLRRCTRCDAQLPSLWNGVMCPVECDGPPCENNDEEKENEK